MSQLKITPEWLDASSNRYEVPHYDASYARWSLIIGDSDVSFNRYRKDGRWHFREKIEGTLYNFAVWVAENWWNILYEFPNNSAGYRLRHYLLTGRSGTALPDLRVSRMADYLLIELNEHKGDAIYPLEFIDRTRTAVSIADAERDLLAFLDTVHDRLVDQAAVTEEFEAAYQFIKSGDEEEQRFCKAAALAGLQPYDVEDSVAEELIDNYDRIPIGVANELFPAVLAQGATQAWGDVERLRKKEASSHLGAEQLLDLKSNLPLVNSAVVQEKPWAFGYRVARQLLKVLDLNVTAERPLSVDGLQKQVLGVSQLPSLPRIHPNIKGLVAADTQSNPVLHQLDGKPENAIFSLARSVFTALTTPQQQIGLVCRTRTKAQQASKAFAAEFLAPSIALKEVIESDYYADILDDEQVQDISDMFNVSSFVVKYQIQNHDLAKLETESDDAAVFLQKLAT